MKRVLATIATPEYQRIHDVTRQRMADYAAEIDADFFVLKSGIKQPTPHFAKFDLIKLMAQEGFDQVLYVDADIHIRQNVPNIFKIYKEAAAFNEMPAHPHPEWAMKAIEWIRVNLDPSWPSDRYFNTGVMLFDKSSLAALAALVKDATPQPGVYYEQDQLNVIMRDADCPKLVLDQRWNQFCQPEWISTPKADNAYFLHVTGSTLDHKLELIQKYARDFP